VVDAAVVAGNISRATDLGIIQYLSEAFTSREAIKRHAVAAVITDSKVISRLCVRLPDLS
jgi:hypothetical protein